jgi:polar amino acid transport system substrate-binding protein
VFALKKKRMNKTIVCGMIMMMINVGSSVYADQLSFVLDPYCPFTCVDLQSNKLDDPPGFIVDIVRRVFEARAHTVRIEVLPWKRALYRVNRGDYTGILGTTRYDSPDLIFPEQESGVIRGCVYVRADDPWQYTGSDSLAGRNIGGVQGVFYGQFQGYIDQHDGTDVVQLLAGTDALPRNVQRLLAGRIDLLLENQSVMLHFFQQQGGAERVREAVCVDELMLYIAFSPQLPKAKEYARILSEGMNELRASGELQAILSQYGLTDWRKTP